MIENDLNQRQS